MINSFLRILIFWLEKNFTDALFDSPDNYMRIIRNYEHYRIFSSKHSFIKKRFHPLHCNSILLYYSFVIKQDFYWKMELLHCLSDVFAFWLATGLNYFRFYNFTRFSVNFQSSKIDFRFRKYLVKLNVNANSI